MLHLPFKSVLNRKRTGDTTINLKVSAIKWLQLPENIKKPAMCVCKEFPDLKIKERAAQMWRKTTPETLRKIENASFQTKRRRIRDKK
jgi:hypothetical protein